MTHEERNTYVAIFTNLFVMGYFIMRLIRLDGEGAFDAPDGLAVWAQTVLWIIPASIVMTIVLTIVFNILFAIATREESPSFVVDERDKMIGRRGMMATIFVASGGFILALIALAFGWTAFFALNVILFAFAGGDLFGSLFKLFFYRRGY